MVLAPLVVRGEDDLDSVRYLLSLQAPSGSWTSAAPLRTTASALLALAGQPTGPGVAAAAQRGSEWLIAQQAEDGSWGEENTVDCGAEQGLSLWALAEWAVIQPAPTCSNVLKRAARHVLAAQQKGGGWAQTLGRSAKATRHSTALQMRALTAAQGAGITSLAISNSLRRACLHLLSYQDQRTGLLDGPAATWAAVAGWQTAGSGWERAVRRAVVAAQWASAQWPRRLDEPLLETLLAYMGATGYRPWPAGEWDRDVRQLLDARRRPEGGWPASTAEPKGGPAYATAMGLLLEQVPTRFATRTARPHAATMLWRVEGSNGSFSLLAALPLRPEDALLIPPHAAQAMAEAARIYALMDERPAGAALREAGLSSAVIRLLELNQRVVDDGWRFEINWLNYASPLALPPRPLLQADQAAACLASDLRDLGTNIALLAEWDGAHLAAFLDEAVSNWLAGREDLLASQPLRCLPPGLAAAWMRHRHAVVAMAVQQLRHSRTDDPAALCCLPAWYVLGDGGLLDELQWHGFRITRTLPPP